MQESISVANANKFSPKPGDKIICKNGDELICCDAAFLAKDGFDVSTDSNLIYGYQLSKHGLYQYGWTFWNEFGIHADERWCIREVIPQSSEVTADKKEEVKEEPRYTMQEIKEAWDASGWVLAISGWDNFQKNLTKIGSPEYQEYLRLKAIYE